MVEPQPAHASTSMEQLNDPKDEEDDFPSRQRMTSLPTKQTVQNLLSILTRVCVSTFQAAANFVSQPKQETTRAWKDAECVISYKDRLTAFIYTAW